MMRPDAGIGACAAFWLALLLAACSATPHGETMSDGARLDASWQAVTAAATPADQRRAIDDFLALNQSIGAPPLMVVVHRRDTGAVARIDQALWDAPSDYEVTLSYGSRRHAFVPLSRSSLEPLFRE